jgi:hypothetical protein
MNKCIQVLFFIGIVAGFTLLSCPENIYASGENEQTKTPTGNELIEAGNELIEAGNVEPYYANVLKAWQDKDIKYSAASVKIKCKKTR